MRGHKIIRVNSTNDQEFKGLNGSSDSNSFKNVPPGNQVTGSGSQRDARSSLRSISFDDDYQSMIQNTSVTDKIQKGSNLIGTLMSDSKIAFGKIFNSVGSLSSRTIESISIKPNLFSIFAGLGSVYTGICSVRNIFQTVSAYGDPKSDKVPWIIYAFQGLFEGCLSFCIAAPFFNIKNPFVQVINGKEVVPLKTIASMSCVPILVSGLINLMTNKSNLLYRIPIIKGPLKDTVSMMSSGLQKLISNTGEQDNSGSSAQLPNLG